MSTRSSVPLAHGAVDVVAGIRPLVPIRRISPMYLLHPANEIGWIWVRSKTDRPV